ncbi:DUF6000 family protein [Dactylosporangium sp. NPDC000521]|uniref:DUF6000 family protein n=1 Tax=Dactylosporangium sp. NPDC000521 TaxID=3363975 RepID=UPI0036C75A43
MHLDDRRGTDRAAAFTVPGGLWERSAMQRFDPALRKAQVVRVCAFAAAAIAGAAEGGDKHHGT